MSSPSGRPRVDSSSRRLAERQQEATSPLAAPPTSSVVAVDDGASELQSQVSLDEFVVWGPVSAPHRLPSSLQPQHESALMSRGSYHGYQLPTCMYECAESQCDNNKDLWLSSEDPLI